MRISIFGATGNVGSRVVAEAVDRGHDITAVVRDPDRAHDLPAGINVRVGNAADVDDIARLGAGQDAVISATRPAAGQEQELVGMTRALLSGLEGTDVRLLLVGGAATLRLPGTDQTVLASGRYLSTEYRGIALASTSWRPAEQVERIWTGRT